MPYALTALADQPNKLLVGLRGGTLLLSDDAAESWSPLALELYDILDLQALPHLTTNEPARDPGDAPARHAHWHLSPRRSLRRQFNQSNEPQALSCPRPAGDETYELRLGELLGPGSPAASANACVLGSESANAAAGAAYGRSSFVTESARPTASGGPM